MKSFEDIISSGFQEDEIREFLLVNGKKPKPISPIYFDIKQEEENSLLDSNL